MSHQIPARVIAILDANAVSIPRRSGPRRIIRNDNISCVPPPS